MSTLRFLAFLAYILPHETAFVNEKGAKTVINIVFGKPGAGKTAFMVSQALEYLTPGAKSRDLLNACRNDVAAVNALGYDFPEPTEAPVYSNFPIRAHVGYERYAETFYVDGFHLGEPVPTI